MHSRDALSISPTGTLVRAIPSTPDFEWGMIVEVDKGKSGSARGHRMSDYRIPGNKKVDSAGAPCASRLKKS